MLKFALFHEDGLPSWRPAGARWTTGSSWVEPFRHPALEDFAVTDGASSFVAVRERAANSPRLGTSDLMVLNTADYAALKTRLLGSTTEFFLVERDEHGDYHVHAGQWGTAPVYVVQGRDHLRGSWAYGDLRQYMRFDQLHHLTVTRILAGRHRYAIDTLFEPVKQITERMTADFDQFKGLTLRYPEEALHATPRDVRDGVDIINVYERELANAVQLWAVEPEQTAVELSGGMDSANVAMTLAALYPGSIRSYALMLGGEVGAQQARRRQAMIDFAGFRDFQVPALDWPPLHPRGGRVHGDPLNPQDEPYYEAVEQMLTRAAEKGITTVYTGDGGDELVALRGLEWEQSGRVPGRLNPHGTPPDWLGPRASDLLDQIDQHLAPTSVINEATHLGFACRTPQFMAAGIWPLSPLCSPRLIRFGEQLPVEWRLNKEITRERLRRLGFSDDVVHPRLRENFVHVMERGLADHGVPLVDEYLAESPLVDLGFVNPDRLREVRDAVIDGRVDTRLFGYLRLELGLRGLLR